MNRSNPLLTVIIPAYNVAPYIREAVESVLRQTMREIDIILVDDGSTDNTTERLRDIQDSRLRIVRQTNTGLASARNTGVRAARTPYLGFLDGDDFWAPALARSHIAFMELHPEVDLTWSLCTMVDEKGYEIGLAAARPKGVVSLGDIFSGTAIRNGGSAVVARRTAIEQAGLFDTALSASEDLDMWLRVAMLRPGNIYCIPEALSFYRRRPGQLSGNWRQMQVGRQELVSKMERLAPNEFQPLEAETGSGTCLYFAFLAHEQEDYFESIRLLWTSFRHDPKGLFRGVDPWLLAVACLAGIVLPREIHRKLTRFGARLHRRMLPWLANRSKPE